MRRRNPSGPPRNRRGSSRFDSDKSSSRKSYRKPGRPASSNKRSGKDSFGSGESFNKGGKKFSSRSEGSGFKRFDKRKSEEGEKPFRKSSRPFSKEGARPLKKFGSKRFEKPASRRTGESAEGRKGSYERSGSSGTLPFKKFEKRPFTKRPRTEGESPKGRRDSYSKRTFSGDSSEKPSFKRFEKKPFAKSPRRDKKSSEGKHGFFSKQNRVRPDTPTEGKFQRKEEQATQTDKIRLNKFISNSGVCSRREADNLIAMGLISVNGKVITEMGYKVNPGDEVRYENKVLRAEKPVYILMNKPKGFLTTTQDPQERNTVMHIIGSAVKERVYPVGRLDRNTTGLLLLTNDGDLAEKLSHPSYNVKKIYKAELDRPLTKNDFQKILDGVELEEGRAMVDDLAIVSDDGKTVGIELHIGWNRVVRRIFEALQYEVVKLDRSVYAGLDKKDLPRGEWRFLKNEEVIRLKHFK